MPNALAQHPANPPAALTSPLTSHQRAALRAAAHGLRPVVLVGERGISDAVIKEIDRALAAHHLIKVRAGSQERADRDAMLAQLCAQLGCQPVHHLGKTLILYRALPQTAEPDNPRKRKASEPYTPKKRAAVGKNLGKKTAAKPKTGGTNSTNPRVINPKATARPARATTATTSAGRARKTTTSTTASALTLRAGVRSSTRAPARSLSRSVGAAKAPARKPTARKTPPRSR